MPIALCLKMAFQSFPMPNSMYEPSHLSGRICNLHSTRAQENLPWYCTGPDPQHRRLIGTFRAA